MHAPRRTPNPRRAAIAAALSLAAGCTAERTTLSSRYEIGRSEPGGIRTVVSDDRKNPSADARMRLEPVARLAFDGRTLPIVSPDGRRAAVQVRTNATWAVQVGDPLPPDGIETRIETISLEAAMPGVPLGALEGAWILGRAATDEGFLAERPREDGGRDVALVSWAGQVRAIVADGWTNAFATTGMDGSMAWSRRKPEGGDWQLVVERHGMRRVLAGAKGESWLLPVFAGDGTGLFALRLVGTSLVVAWLPFGNDGMPALPHGADAMVALVSLRANLSAAVTAMIPSSGLSASPPGRERVTFWAGDQGRMVLWAPGGRIEPLAAGSVAATPVDPGNVLVTLPAGLARQQLGPNELPIRPLLEGAWLTRPIVGRPEAFVAMRALDRQVEFARAVLDIPKSPTP
jgi:hypothetical protein